MKEVNANIIYTKVSPTEYIGEFTVSPEETTDYELRAIDDENVVEKCEVQIEQEVLPAFAARFGNGYGVIDVQGDSDVNLAEQSSYFVIGLNFEDNVSRKVNYTIFTQPESGEMEEVETGYFMSNVPDDEMCAPQVSFEGYDKVVVMFTDVDFKFYVNYTGGKPTPPFEDEFSIYVNNSLAEDMGRYTSNDGGLFELRATSKHYTVSKLNYVVSKPVGTGVIVYEPISQGKILVDNEYQAVLESPDWDGYNQVKVEIAGGISFFVNKYQQS